MRSKNRSHFRNRSGSEQNFTGVRDDAKDFPVRRGADRSAFFQLYHRGRGEVMSEDAVKFLHAHNITTSGTLLVPRILNRKRNGLCPLEQSVAGIDDPAKALVSLKQRIATLRGDK